MSDRKLPERPSRRLGSGERPVRLPGQPGSERRAASRFPLTLGLRYAVLNPRQGVPETGSGQTVDLSSSGLRFVAERPLEPGLTVELFIDWPVLLDGGVQLQLTTSGTVVRSDGNTTALRIQRHGFKTKGRGLKSA
jgi:hypothetical protein